jgi:hypothetical protein
MLAQVHMSIMLLVAVITLCAAATARILQALQQPQRRLLQQRQVLLQVSSHV